MTEHKLRDLAAQELTVEELRAARAAAAAWPDGCDSMLYRTPAGAP